MQDQDEDKDKEEDEDRANKRYEDKKGDYPPTSVNAFPEGQSQASPLKIVGED